MNSIKILFLLFKILVGITSKENEIVLKDNTFVSTGFSQYPYSNKLLKIFSQYGKKMYNQNNIIQKKILGNQDLFKYLLIFGASHVIIEKNKEKFTNNLLKAVYKLGSFAYLHPCITGITVGIIASYSYSNYFQKEHQDFIGKIETLLSNQTYEKIIENQIKNDLEELIDEGFDKIDLDDYIKNFVKDNLEYLNSKFNGDINSIDFMLIGQTGEGKSTLCNSILEIESGKDGAYVNEETAESTTNETKRYNNTNKIGLNIWDTKGCEINEKNSFQKRINELYKDMDKITLKDNIFIFGFIYVTSLDSFNEKDDLDNILNHHLNKLPLKIVVTKHKNTKQKKRMNNTIYEKMNFKPYFLGDSENYIQYKKNIKFFLEDLMKELDEEKLKDIYNYYFSLHILSIIMEKLTITLDKFDKIAISLPPSDKYLDYLKNRFKADLEIIFLGEELNFDKIFNKLDNIFIEYKEELKRNESIKNDENLKDYEEKNFYEKIKSYLYKNNLSAPIYINIYHNLRNLSLEILKEKFKLKIVHNAKINELIKRYPNFIEIKKNIYNNFIKDSKNNLNEEL